MNIPETVKIGGHILDVITTNNADYIECDTIGKTTLAKNVIYLNASYPLSRREEAFLHEMIHNCIYDLDHGAEQDEALVERLGTLLYAIVKDNPKVFSEGDT